MKRVVITGLGIVVPSGVGVGEFWHNSNAGRSYTHDEPDMVRMGLASHVLGRVRDFRVEEHLSPDALRDVADLSRFSHFGVVAGVQAARDAGLPDAALAPERAAVICASAIAGTPEFQAMYEEGSRAGTRPVAGLPADSSFYDAVFANFTPTWLARRFGLRGPCTALTTGCTAGVDALGLGFDLVRHGELDLALTGAAEAPLCGISYATLDIIGSLARVDCPGPRASRPFDARRGGFVLSEGAATLALEEYEHAKRRGARVYAEVIAFASLNNAAHMTDLAPDGASMAHVIRRCLDDAGADPASIDYINAHGSSTPQNDLFETMAFKSVLGEHAYRVPISSTKSMIGHPLSPASLVGVIAAVGAMETGMVPPTINYEVPDPECDLDYVPNQARHARVRRALVTASGFGGIHSSTLLGAVAD
ncbi:MAG: beta-ketoacyl-[acyl-carrier-protein] synthase family protein [Chloroflexi bacterium]|nr:MAG: beta-ketoacyl-[acyl-carrier-protein] synthase family protein [Chloroflexota bacterium]